MKAILLLFFSLFFIISCQEHKETPISATEEENGLQETVDSLSKATAIFWIDKYHMKEMKKDDALSFRTDDCPSVLCGSTACKCTTIYPLPAERFQS